MERATLPALVRDSTLSPDLLESLQMEPWRFGFLSLLRRIGANPAVDPVGTARRPRSEPFRLGQQPSLAFAPREIASVQEAAGRLKVRLFGLGMLGPNGPLPIHVTEWAREREESRRDTTTVDFFDIFHHRFLTLFYRAWASAQSTAGLDRKDDERFSFYIASLTGHDTAEIARRPLPSHARLAASAHLVRESRDADGLRATLEHYFGVPVAIDEHVFHWIAIDPADQGRMGRPGPAATMGQAAMLGRVAPDRQHRFRIVIGPIDLDAYLRFTPQGEDLPRLVEWVRAFVGYELEWELELRIKPESAPPAVMGGRQRIGWSGWLGRPNPDRPITGMRFEPERYVRHFERRTAESDNRP
ncbi:type VI secretion system baseplate subunit TssG [Burkholderia sp. MS389]|uniref:type VI secretion system baseplate subunit TssG n=1 Tax=unclassified Burkholderia TaxID=2613784 RepID=UPI000B79C5C9|nr:MULTISPECIES: type VI secretion system baseplate subunit TssG [unclassified Burkholderia]OXI71323.1 type VI secretion protein [Burkholderia sp. AU31280]QRR15586.1 type VI secretion system baseplate subunit TssG [Burkholderia sp. MS389]